MKFGLRGGFGALLAVTLFAAPAMGQQAAEEEEDSGPSLQDGVDVAQDLAEDALDPRKAERRPASQVRGTPHPTASGATSVAEESVQGLEALSPVEDDAAKAMLLPSAPPRGPAPRPGAMGGGLQGAGSTATLGDDTLHAVPLSSFGDDAARGVHAGAYADNVVRGVGSGVGIADDAARLAGGGLAKIGGALAVLGALLAKLFGGGKKDE
ncbi:hypothetical protein [Hyalangium rubrum]|uniref:Uncharacterized protein n=1 Tax=Hyalangium rubrum TaxID=3103134 RepID=A0ABU5H205_9BACT|nr:hypothetical protein [Hyalangium sp. s54d21]MDY7227351.1 hypothetical protein [Hyalangium sp. s54d21]